MQVLAGTSFSRIMRRRKSEMLTSYNRFLRLSLPVPTEIPVGSNGFLWSCLLIPMDWCGRSYSLSASYGERLDQIYLSRTFFLVKFVQADHFYW